MKRKLLLLPLTLCLAACQPDLGITQCERTPDMPPELKMEHYRGATPACVPNAITLNVTELQTLLQTAEPVLIDVWAILRRNEPGFPSEWLPNEDHYSLPEAVWLPNVGYGTLDAEMETYLHTHLGDWTLLHYLVSGFQRLDGNVILGQGDGTLQTLFPVLHLLFVELDPVGVMPFGQQC